MSTKLAKLTPLLAGLLFSCSAMAATTTGAYKDNFSGATSQLSWLALNDGCLTAGTSGSGTAGVIPGCSNIGVTAPADAVGSGALRLTPAQNSQTGAILSNFTFPMTQGLQVTFTTYTYGGDSGGTAKNGADGITFFLTDGTTKTAPTTTGASGGAMGYGCSNTNGPVGSSNPAAKFDGVANGYLGLGIDEFGNYLNTGDNGSVGIYNSNDPNGTMAYGTNSYYNANGGTIDQGTGPQYQPERIGLRAAGNTNWAWLQSQNPSYYTISSGGPTPETLVHNACKSGKYVSSGTNGNKNLKPIPGNYNAIPGGYQVLPNSTPIANEGTKTRVNTTPSKNAWPINYKLTLSAKGLLNFSYSYNNGAYTPVLANHDVTADSGTPPSALRFGFSAGTGGSNNVHEITCFQAAPLQSNSSASANTVQSGQYRTGTQVYLASYTADNWWGSVVSDSINVSGSALVISSIANWDANCVLTGGGCATMGTDPAGNPTTTVKVQGPTARTLLTWDSAGGAAQALQWNSLTTNQQKALNSSDNAGASRVAWLRGDRTVEQLQSPPGSLRARTGVVGDIMDSSPTWVGAPVSGANPDVFTDALYGTSVSPPENGTLAQAYSTFVSSNATRLNVVYVGSNDGFLHGFRAGSYDSSGNYTSTNSANTYVGTNNDGLELLGFMPSNVLSSTATVNLTNPTYVHNYFVDATPAAADLFYNNTWHTWLVGGVGTGGTEIYALDITNPSGFSESSPSSTVMGDWSNATLPHLGQTVGTPVIARMHNGQWAIIFGNGLGSNTSAGVYIGLVDSKTGAVTFKFIDTGVGSATSANGIAYVVSADLDGDHIADYLYAGDLQGNVWRIDVTGSTPASWGVSQFGTGAATPLFVAAVGTALQPITTASTIAGVKTGAVNRVMVFFGTGQKTPLTAINPDVYATGQQTFYGIWDWDMTAWNKVAGSKAQYASLTGSQSITRSNLLAQSVVATLPGSGSVQGYRTLSTTNVVCWQGSTTCGSGNSQYGWMFDLPATQEQIIYNPAIIGGAVVVSTAIPPVISAALCNPGLQSGWTMAFDPASGGALNGGFFPGVGGGFGNGANGSAIAGVQYNAVGTPTAITYNGQTYIVTQTVTGVPAISQVNPPSNDVPSRISWREIRN